MQVLLSPTTQSGAERDLHLQVPLPGASVDDFRGNHGQILQRLRASERIATEGAILLNDSADAMKARAFTGYMSIQNRGSPC